MRRALTVVVLWVVASPAVALADDSPTYRAELGPVDPAATEPAGNALLVDLKFDHVTVNVEGLLPETRYPWHVHEFAAGVTDPCLPDARQGPIVTAFRYGPLTANSHGNASATATSELNSFVWGEPGYYVNIHDPLSAAPIACGVLTQQ